MQATTALFLAFTTLIAAGVDNVDDQAAFQEYVSFSSGGVWVSEGPDGNVQVDRHIVSKGKKFARVESITGGEFFNSTYGLDPKSGRLTLWAFANDGSVGTWTLTGYEKGRWEWEGTSVGAIESVSSTVVVTKTGDDEQKLVMTVKGKEPVEAVWKRQSAVDVK